MLLALGLGLEVPQALLPAVLAPMAAAAGVATAATTRMELTEELEEMAVTSPPMQEVAEVAVPVDMCSLQVPESMPVPVGPVANMAAAAEVQECTSAQQQQEPVAPAPLELSLLSIRRFKNPRALECGFIDAKKLNGKLIDLCRLLPFQKL